MKNYSLDGASSAKTSESIVFRIDKWRPRRFHFQQKNNDPTPDKKERAAKHETEMSVS
jgi:hypothetical protein